MTIELCLTSTNCLSVTPKGTDISELDIQLEYEDGSVLDFSGVKLDTWLPYDLYRPARVSGLISMMYTGSKENEQK